jgi:diguanylate cyclase (GGDEF)-like protein
MQKIAILYDASQAVLSTFDLDEVLNQILNIVRDYFHLHSGGILLLDPETQELVVRTSFGTPHASTMRLMVGKGLTGTAAKLRRPMYAPDVDKDPRYVRGIDSTKSELAIPLMVRDDVVGVLDCQSDELDHFASETIDLLTLFATQASIAIANAQLYSMERKRAIQMEAINAIAKQTTATLEPKDLMEKVCSLMLQFFPVEHTAILLREEGGGRLVLQAQSGGSEDYALQDYPAQPCQRALSTNTTVVENDIGSSGMLNGQDVRAEARSRMCTPLVSFGETIGVLVCESIRPRAFQSADVQALESVADIVATAIQNAGYVEKIRQLAFKDGLTGLFNRRFFEMRILEEIERTTRYKGSMSVVMIDIDHFKRINDEFGHLLGDEVLRQVSNILAQHLRKLDFVCRFGGEEFAIILPETPGDNAVAVADKLRRVVEGWHFPGVPRPVTISAGVAATPMHGKNRDEIIRSADMAMYSAKQSGRNLVVYAGEVSAAAAK